MRLQLSGPEDVNHLMSRRFQVVGDQGPMASPPDGFGAHHGCAPRSRRVHQTFNTIAEWFCEHVIRIAAERFVPPRRVRRIGLRFATSTQFGKVEVIDARAVKRLREWDPAEVGMTARAGKVANVRQESDVLALKQGQELFERSRRMSNRPNGGRAHGPT